MKHRAAPTIRTSALEELARASAIRRGRRVELVPRIPGGPVARGVLLRNEAGSALVLWDDGAISGCRSQFLKREPDDVARAQADAILAHRDAARAAERRDDDRRAWLRATGSGVLTRVGSAWR